MESGFWRSGAPSEFRFSGGERAKERQISGTANVASMRELGFALRIERQFGRDGISCRLTEPPWTLQPLRPSRSSNGTDRCAIHGDCTPVRPRRIAQGGDLWTMVGRRFSPYRSRASPRLQLPAFTKFARAAQIGPTIRNPSISCRAGGPIIFGNSTSPCDTPRSRQHSMSGRRGASRHVDA